MKYVVWAVALFLATTGAALALPSAQPLSIVIHRGGAETHRLPQYDSRAPVTVHVTETIPGRVDGVTLVVTSPGGERLLYPLVHAADGSFGGQISLPDEGRWSIGIATQVASLVTDTAPFTLDVSGPLRSNSSAIGLAVGAGIFILFGVGGFVLLQRRARKRAASPALGHAVSTLRNVANVDAVADGFRST